MDILVQKKVRKNITNTPLLTEELVSGRTRETQVRLEAANTKLNRHSYGPKTGPEEKEGITLVTLIGNCFIKKSCLLSRRMS